MHAAASRTGIANAKFAEVVMMRSIATGLSTLGVVAMSASATAGPTICIRAITEIELLHRIRQDAYFSDSASLGKRLRIEYDGCGYRIHVGEHSPVSRDGDLLLVNDEGRVTQVVRQH